MLDELLSAWSQVEEIPEYPGSYYVSRSIYQSFWNVVNANKNTKDMLMKYGRERTRKFRGNGNSIKADNNALSFIKTG